MGQQRKHIFEAGFNVFDLFNRDSRLNQPGAERLVSPLSFRHNGLGVVAIQTGLGDPRKTAQQFDGLQKRADR